ncbi:integrase [Streptomyces sp. NPDC057428]|uniref:integrase n=1 Tax=Streptomyces sp. NPDC057428 TaxID=3346129 RepID=UPI0036BAB446
MTFDPWFGVAVGSGVDRVIASLPVNGCGRRGEMAGVRVTMTSVAAWTGRVNEDFVGVLPGAAVLVDGAGIPGTEAICRHGVAWYAGRLGGSLLGLLPFAPERSLTALLAEAIGQVTDAHRDTCDVADPISPSAAVAVMRLSGGYLDHLVLGDSLVVLDVLDGTPVVVSDPRETDVSRPYRTVLEALPAGGDEYRRLLSDMRANRNRPGGFWVAKDDPRAADEAITGSRPVSEVTGVALLSNGAGRIVDPFRLADWPEVMVTLAAVGPVGLVERVRRAEAHRAVTADDATIAYCSGLDEDRPPSV